MAVVEINRAGRATRYEVRFGYFRARDGAQRYKTRSFPTRTEADEFDRSVRGVAISPETATVAMLAAAWEAEAWLELAPRTRTYYDGHLQMRILPKLGSKRADRLTPRMLDEWQQWMVAQHHKGTKQQRLISNSTANGSLRTLRALLRWSRRKGYCTTRVADDTKTLPEAANHTPHPLSTSDIDSIASACDTLLETAIVLVAAYTGLRWSEIRTLRWDDVNFAQRYVSVERAADPHHVEGNVKSRAALRKVPIIAPGIAALLEWRDAFGGNGLIFPDEKGRIMGDDWFNSRIRRITRNSGVQFTFNNFRDTYASIHVAADTPMLELAQIMGHTSIQTTRKHYTGTHESRLGAIADRVNAILPSL